MKISGWRYVGGDVDVDLWVEVCGGDLWRYVGGDMWMEISGWRYVVNCIRVKVCG